MVTLTFKEIITGRLNNSTPTRSGLLIARLSRLFLLIAILQFAIVLSVQIMIVIIDRAGMEQDTDDEFGIYSYLYMIVLFHQVWLVWDGVRHTNIFEIYGFVALNVVYCIFSSAQTFDVLTQENETGAALVSLTVISTTTLFLASLAAVYFTLGISNQYRWEMFKTIGNNVVLRKAWYLQLSASSPCQIIACSLSGLSFNHA